MRDIALVIGVIRNDSLPQSQFLAHFDINSRQYIIYNVSDITIGSDNYWLVTDSSKICCGLLDALLGRTTRFLQFEAPAHHGFLVAKMVVHFAENKYVGDPRNEPCLVAMINLSNNPS